jgi:hypothetical protein
MNKEICISIVSTHCSLFDDFKLIKDPNSLYKIYGELSENVIGFAVIICILSLDDNTVQDICSFKGEAVRLAEIVLRNVKQNRTNKPGNKFQPDKCNDILEKLNTLYLQSKEVINSNLELVEKYSQELDLEINPNVDVNFDDLKILLCKSDLDINNKTKTNNRSRNNRQINNKPANNKPTNNKPKNNRPTNNRPPKPQQQEGCVIS